MIRTILTYPDPFLATRAAPVSKVGDSVRTLVRDLFETMYAASGVGLAATQIGVGKRVIVIDISPVEEEAAPLALVNPEIVESQGCVQGPEGCLSVPGVEGEVARAETILVQGMDGKGSPLTLRAQGLLARAIQHEIDHLDGILFIDRLTEPAASAQ
ncbi:MAG TPA: peptide deformylase [Deltaproteobacteria bacterium]|nr:MAG: peptide deformylase [Deltaproteobacteria bacterium GWC2_65_14]HBO70512.1 peptide deformylase [Deltaproteobacteria bacterium]